MNWKKIKDMPSDDSVKISAPAAEANDTLWKYDVLHSAHQGECEEILIEKPSISYQDLRSEPTRKESHIETCEDQEDEYLAHAGLEHMELNDQAGKQTWCPICMQGELQENSQLIYFSALELRLCKDDKKLMEHLDWGCRLKPKIRIDTSFGFTALYFFCEGCNT